MRTSACHLGHQPIHTILGLSNQFCSDPKMEKKYVQLFFYFKREKVQSDRANVCIGLCNPCSGIILVFFLLKLIGSSRGSSECRTWIEDPHHCEWKLQTSIMAVVLSIISLRIWFNFFYLSFHLSRLTSYRVFDNEVGKVWAYYSGWKAFSEPRYVAKFPFGWDIWKNIV